MASSCGRKRARAQVAKTDASGIRCTKRALRWPDAGASLRSMDSEIALGSAWLSSVELLTEIPDSRPRRITPRTTTLTFRNLARSACVELVIRWKRSPFVKDTTYRGNSVTGLSCSKGESSLAFGYASFDRRNRVKRASYIKRFITPSLNPPARNNTHPGIIVSKGAY